MFRKWLNENDLNNFDFSTPLFPKAKDREFWDKFYSKNRIIYAENRMNCDWPVMKASDFMAFHKTGDRSEFERKHYERRTALCELAIGELLEYKGRFIPAIVDGLLAICEETYWGASAHRLPMRHRTQENIPNVDDPYLDLHSSQTACTIAVIYNLLYDEIYAYCPEILTRIENELEKRIKNQYLRRMDHTWMGYYYGVNNWNPWILSHVITVFLMTENRRPVLKDAMQKMIYEIQSIYDAYPADGGCDEGTAYWFMSGGGFFEFCEQLYTATGGKINFLDDEKIKNIGKFIYRSYIGDDYYINFADCGPKRENEESYLIYKFGKGTKNETLMAFAKERHKNYKGEEVLPDDTRKYACDLRKTLDEIILNKEINTAPDYVGEDSFCLESLQTGAARENDWYYATKGGSNKPAHSHNDIGSFIAYFNNAPVLLDPSCSRYTKKHFTDERYTIWTNQSDWHNLPKVNGFSQVHGDIYKADSFKLEKKKANISFASAYDRAAGLVSLDREISFDKGVKICDRFVFEKDTNTIDEHFITNLEVEIRGDSAVIDGKFVLTADCEGAFTKDYISFDGEAQLTKYWNNDHMNRIIFSAKAGKEKEITFTLSEIK